LSPAIQIYCRRPSLGEMHALLDLGVEYLAWHIRPENGASIVEAERMTRVIHDAGRRASLLVHSNKVDVLSAIARMVQPDFLLMSSDRDDAAMPQVARDIGPNIRLMMSVPVPAVGSSATVNSRGLASEYQTYAGALTVDTLTDASHMRQFGCTGITNDWSVCAEIVAASSVPVVLAGGLNAGNVADAIRRVRPPIVDACTALEFPDKSKDLRKCREFIEAVRNA
jgi:phosphoribosylanthranilate isomerase